LAELVNAPRITDKQTKTGRARVLTSTECIRTFEAKEEQKRLAQEEKQKRKEERELQQRKQISIKKKPHRQASNNTEQLKVVRGQQIAILTSRTQKSRTVDNADDEIDVIDVAHVLVCLEMILGQKGSG